MNLSIVYVVVDSRNLVVGGYLLNLASFMYGVNVTARWIGRVYM